MKKLYLPIILFTMFLSGCGCGDVVEDIYKPPYDIKEGKLSLIVIEHKNYNYYVANVSDTPYYVAVNVANNSNTAVTINDIAITDTTQFALISANLYFPNNSTRCSANVTLSVNSSCEILVGLTDAKQISNAISQLKITTKNNVVYTKQLIKHPFAYIAGNFSKTYNSQPIIDATIKTNSHCGVNQDSVCAILEYDIDNNTVTNIAQTNWNINSIVADNNGVLYVGGGFDTGFNQTQTIYGPTSNPNSTFVLTLNPTSGEISDFLQNIGQNYPDGDVYSLAYDANNLYMTGGFDSIGNISVANNYPLVKYNFITNTLENALGNNSNNADAPITALGFDKEHNLYVSGMYSILSNFVNLQPFGMFAINKCELNNGVYTCGNNTNDFVDIDSSTSYQPATSLTFNNNNLYTAGGFSQINNTVGMAGTQNYIVAELNGNDAIWSNLTSGQSADRAISVVTPLSDSQGYYVGGWFSTIGGLSVNATEAGQCGLDTDQFSNGINSCMLGKYNASSATWSKIFTTDGMINTFSISSKLSIL